MSYTREEAYENNIIKNWKELKQGSSKWDGSGLFRSAGAGDGIRTFNIAEDDLPMGATGFARIDTTSATNSNNCIGQDAVPLTIGETYTLGCFARGKGKVDIGPTQNGYAPVLVQKIDQENWRFFCGTFVAASTSQNIFWRNRSIGSDEYAGVLDICAPILIEGGWSR